MMRFLSLSLFFVLATHLPAQEFTGAIPMSLRYGLDPHAVPTLEASPFDATAAAMDDAVRDAANKLPLYARFVVAPADLDNAGVWTELPGGDRIWRLRVVSPGAHAMELFFSDVYLPPGSQVHVYDDAREQVIGGSTAAHVQADGSFTTDMVYGDACTVEYHEPAAVRGEGSLHLEKVAHAYRMVAQVKSGTCEVDVNCSEGANWVNERNAVVRIRVVIPSGAGFCTGTLVNNTASDCKGYILTAFHCTEESVTTNYPSYQFRFQFQRTVCGTGSATGSGLTGCARRAGSQDQGGALGSDYSLIELTSAIPGSYTPYWAGWDAETAAPVGGVSLHHPDSDVKKISTFTGTASSATWGGTANGSHWRVVWTATANGHGVTEPGSSGSPIFNSAKKLVGTLTGGLSCCTTNACGSGTSLTAPDYYGKMSYHWGASNPNPTLEQLHWWLAPVGTATSQEGSVNPCEPIGIPELTLPSVEVFPNPTRESVTIRLPQQVSGSGSVVISDVTGRVVHTERIGGTPVLDLDARAWRPGTYMITVIGGTTPVAAARIVVVD
ncbi:MAG: T9SS type A sorting domain-containing protein [Flavobacteriales bacterium]|nr:T9SS type A sorting domain-containing protein [Flavobacteriales bacterium]